MFLLYAWIHRCIVVVLISSSSSVRIVGEQECQVSFMRASNWCRDVYIYINFQMWWFVYCNNVVGFHPTIILNTPRSNSFF